MSPHAALLLLVLVLPAADKKEAAPTGDLKKMQGAWKAARVVYNGDTLPADAEGKFKLTIKGKIGTLDAHKSVKGEYARFEFTLDETTKPRCMDVNVLLGGQKGVTLEAIYKLDGDKLTICTKVLGMNRPAKFASPAGESVALIELERVKKD
jgi:uncharacterized protein (TIGR03067 family)